jgi:hypothetical protein
MGIKPQEHVCSLLTIQRIYMSTENSFDLEMANTFCCGGHLWLAGSDYREIHVEKESEAKSKLTDAPCIID